MAGGPQAWASGRDDVLDAKKRAAASFDAAAPY